MNNLIRIFSLFLFVLFSLSGMDTIAQDNLEVFAKKGLEGLRNKETKQVLLEPTFQKIFDFDRRAFFYAKVANNCVKKTWLECQTFGAINTKGEIVADCKYSSIEFSYYSGKWSDSSLYVLDLAKVELDNKYGLINLRTKKEILPPIADNIIGENFTSLYDFFSLNKLIIYTAGDSYGMVSESGKKILEAQRVIPIKNNFNINGALGHSYSHAIFIQNGKYGLADKNGIVLEAIYDSIFSYNGLSYNNWIGIVKDNKYGLFHKKLGNAVTCISPEILDPLTLDINEKNGKKGGVDYFGNVVIPYEYDQIDQYGYGKIGDRDKCRYWIVSKENKYGAFLYYEGNDEKKMKKKEMIIPVEFNKPFIENNKWVFISSKDTIDFRPSYFTYANRNRAENVNLKPWIDISDIVDKYSMQSYPEQDKICHCCKGSGEYKNYDNPVYETCSFCDGKGYVSGFRPNESYQCNVCGSKGKVFLKHEKSQCVCCNGKGIKD